MTQTERQAVLNFKITGNESVGELKDHLKDLKKALNDTTIGSDEYKKSIKGIAETQEKLTGVMTDSRVGVEKAKDSYYALNEELVKLRKEYKSLSEEDRNGSVGTSKLERIQELDSRLKSLDATMGQYQRNVGHYQLALEALNKTYANSKQELAAMKSAMDNLDPSSKDYAEAFQRAAQITHDLSERQTMLKYSSKDLGDQLSNIRGIATNMVAGFSAVNAAMGLFGKESDDVQKAMLKVQQAMALVQGLQGLDGLIKRTQGLANALTKTKKLTVEQTVATTAEATATAGQTVATEAATVAQKGLNVAMKANPIGIVLLAVEALIAVFVLFKDKIIDLLGGQEKLNASWNKMKVAIVGVGNAILQYFITPLKMAHAGLKGFAKIMDDIAHGRLKQAWQDAGKSIIEWKDAFVNGVSFASNYEKAASEQRIKNAEQETKKKKETYEKDKDNYIKDQEAKNGSDWKYTEEGKKAYDELFKNRLDMYNKDSEEYRQAQRDMWQYQREYNDRMKRGESEKAAAAKAAADKIKQEWQQVLNEFKTKVTDYTASSMDKILDSSLDRLKAFTKAAGLEVDTFALLSSSIEKGIGNDFETLFTTLQLKFNEMPIKFQRAFNKLKNQIAEDIGGVIKENFLTELSKLETNAKASADAIANVFTEKEFKDGITYPTEAMQYAAAELGVYVDAFEKMNKALDEEMETLRNAGFSNTQAYKDLETKKTEIANEEHQRRMEYAQREAEYVKASYDSQLNAIAIQYERLQAKFLNGIDSNSSFMDILSGVWPKEEKQRMEESYAIFKEGLEKRKEVLQQMANDTSLSANQRLEAEQELAVAIAEIEDAEAAHTLQMNQQRVDAWKFYVDAVSDGIDAIGQLFGSLADYYEADLDAKVKNNEMTEEQAKANFENIKSMRVAETVINTIAGAAGAFLQASENYPPPYGQILGGITAAAVTASGLAEIKKIKSSTYGSNSTGGGTSASYATVTPVQTDFNPQGVTNVTGGQETENLRNALMNANFVVSVTDINNVQNKVKVRESEARF